MYGTIKLDLFGPEAHNSGGADRHDHFGDLHLILSILEQFDDEPFTAANPYVELFQRLEAIVGKEHVALRNWRQRLNHKVQK